MSNKQSLGTEFIFKHSVVKDILKREKADTLLLVSDQNRLWFTEFASTFGFLFINKSKAILVTDARYFEAAQRNIKNVEVVLYNSPKILEEVAKKINVDQLIIEGEYLTYNYEGLLNKLSSKKPKIISSQILRAIKTPKELKLMQEVVNITAKVGNNLTKWIKPNMTEIDLAKKITIELINAGGEKNSFDPIVASGTNGSSPHHHPTNKKLVMGEFVTCDFGTTYKGYCSDITRTFVVGNKPKNQRLVNAYRVVDAANRQGIKACKAGIKGMELDTVCRNYINQTEFKKYFVHSTGHGVGLDVHELPNVSPSYNFELLQNSIVTVEPGIYIPKVGGIRIEDMVLVKDKKSIWMSEKIYRPKF
ncbi:aminopeptidase P family protein [Mycoplasmoides pirum]|uniref:aminopeptidase P family protein n=1 Tax=Mycoplasmoides pirum TaxID=2122 RepID=UPI0006990794|nr:aminopeptidase P family protein [Mycoplasmoides pirum]